MINHFRQHGHADVLGATRVTESLDANGIYRCDGVPYGDDPHGWVLEYSRRLGTIIPQYGVDVLEIKPKDGAAPNGPFGMGVFPLHTDGIFRRDELCPDLVVMLCVRPGKGGEHLVADAKTAIARLRGSMADRLDTLLGETIVFLCSGSVATGTEGGRVLAVAPKSEPAADLYRGPILNPQTGRLRYSTTLMSPLHEDHAALSSALNEQAFMVPDIASGTLWVVDNNRMVHGRKAIESDDRLMLRVHVKKK